jgi:hypothetical protein
MPIVREIPGLKRSFGGRAQAEWLAPGAAVLQAAGTTIDLKILQEKDGFSLVSESSHVHFSGGDTWHPTLEDMMAQAEHQFAAPSRRHRRTGGYHTPELVQRLDSF